jgi:hypothetical protein
MPFRELSKRLADGNILVEVSHMRAAFLSCTLAIIASSVFGQTVTLGLDTTFQVSYVSNLNLDDSVVNITNTGLQGGFGLTGAAGSRGNICANVYVFDPQEEEIGCCSCLVTPNGLNSLSAKNDLISNNLTPAVPTSIVIKIVGTQPEIATDGSFTICNPSNLTDGTNNAKDRAVSGLLAWGTNTHVATGGSVYHTEMPFRPATILMPGATVTVTTTLVTAGNNQITVTSVAGLVIGQTVSGSGIPTGTTLVGFGPGPLDLGLSASATASATNIPLTFSTTPLPSASASEFSQLGTFCRFIQANGSGYGICKSCRLGALGGSKQ